MTSLETGSYPDGHEISEEILPFILADSAYSNTQHMVMTYKTTEILASPFVHELNKKLGGGMISY